MAAEAQPKYKGLQKLETRHLTVGMYVAQLDCEWEDTNYALQGFYVRSRQTIERLTHEHAFIYVDPRRYDSKLGETKLTSVTRLRDPQQKLSARERLQPQHPQL